MNSHYQETKNFFNKTVLGKKGYYTNPKSVPYLIQERLKEKVLEWVRGYQPKRILDAGCGRGDFSMALASYFPRAEIEGVDFSEEMVKLARQSFGNAGRLKFSQADLLQLPFQDGSFDLVFCLDTLHHIHKDDFPRAIGEIARVNRKTVIVEFKNRQTIFWPIYKLLFKKSNPGIEYFGTTLKILLNLFGQNGFSLKKKYNIFKHQILSPNILVQFERK